MSKNLATLFLLACLAAYPATTPADAMRAKLDLIQSGRAAPGSVISFSSEEVNAYAREEVPKAVPQGMREPRLQLGEGTVVGTALVDFAKLRRAGSEAGIPWLLGKLIEGEKPITVKARIQSRNGTATVALDSVEIAGVAVSGSALDFLIQAFLLPQYPDAKIGTPFDLGYGLDRIEVQPGVARAVLKK